MAAERPSADRPFTVAEWRVDPRDNTLSRDGHTVRLEPKVMQVLVCLAAHRGEVMSREALEAEAWEGVVVGYDSVTRTIIKLRKAFEDDSRHPRIIETVPKKGYRLIAPVDTVGEPTTTAAAEPTPAPPPRRQWVVVTGLGAALMVGAALAWWQPWSAVSRSEAPSARTVAAEPSVAVLPFANLSGREDLEYFSDGVTDELITSLSQISALKVIARTSSFVYEDQVIDIKEVGDQLGVRYVLEGSVRRHGDRVRINVHLVDAESGFQIWAKRYDRQLADVLVVQEEITRRVVDSLSVELTALERRRLASRYTNDVRAYDAFLRGQAAFVRHTPEANRRARALFTRAIERDPAFARAYGGKALTYADGYRFWWDADPDTAARRARELAEKAVALDVDSPEVNWVLGYVELFINRDRDASIEAGERALEVDPNSADAHALLARAYVSAGKPDRARELIEQAMQLNPHYPSQYPSVLGYAHFFAKRYDSARVALEEAIRINPTRLPPNVYLVATHVRADRMGDAQWRAQMVHDIEPDFDPQEWATRQVLGEAQTKTLVADLERAGL